MAGAWPGIPRPLSLPLPPPPSPRVRLPGGTAGAPRRAQGSRCGPTAAPAHLHLHEGAAVEAAGGRGQGAPQAAPLGHGAARPAGAAPARAAPPLPPPPPPGFNFSRFPDYLIPCRLRGAGTVRQLRPGPPLGAAAAPGNRGSGTSGGSGTPAVCALRGNWEPAPPRETHASMPQREPASLRGSGTSAACSLRGTGNQLLREEPALPCRKGNRHPCGDQAPLKRSGNPVLQREAASLRAPGTPAACALKRTGTSGSMGHP